ncbi:NAD(P)H-dependent oxidoreductase [uncultured Cyclobacterium sp.]|uniref:NADPH-dependent FMN reductase n=1 Tax=uncultured Cyclobacterium sp. TaxID=453820 RepID=UPI0030EB864F|tara:strand:- start:125703 stop:126257 length:555 start_codon:yes stop_codon:yes gene_type:complete
MKTNKTILGICGSASKNSGNLALLKYLTELGKADFNMELLDDLTELPHFQTALTENNVPEKIIVLREKITKADGVIICTPEYVFSIPSGLKNLLEWCVATTVFSEKPVGLVTASASGVKGHEELKLIMETIQATFKEETTLLIQGIKGKVNTEGEISDKDTRNRLAKFLTAFVILTDEAGRDKS